MKYNFNTGIIFCIITAFSLLFISCDDSGGGTVTEIYAEGAVTPVVFSGPTTIVNFSELSNKNIYLVKVNMSSATVSGSQTGSARSFISDFENDDDIDIDEPDFPRFNFPVRGRPLDEEIYYPLPIPSSSRTLTGEELIPLASFTPPAIGTIRDFWVESAYGNRNFVQKPATLSAIGNNCNIWVMEGSISDAKANELAVKFNQIYPAATNIIGFEYGGGPGGNGGVDGDPKIQILVYNIGHGVAGYFWSKDYYDQSQLTGVNASLRTNKAEIFYMDAAHVKEPNINSPASTLVHELQHMVNFNRKTLRGYIPATWYNEMLSLMLEDVMAGIIGYPVLNNSNLLDSTDKLNVVIDGHVMLWFIDFFFDYYKEGVTEWVNRSPSEAAIPYATKYAFGAYLLRNYGGAELLKRIMDSNSVNEVSITAALSGSLTFDDVLRRYGEALVFSGSSMPAGVNSFDRTVTHTVNGTPYTIGRIDIHSFSNFGVNLGGNFVPLAPFIHNVKAAQPAMRQSSINVFDAPEWRNVSGDISITLNRPGNRNILYFLMVK
ncbi:MAG: hypothetical protein FWD47_08940 [Treponema sp.]|nr:hypothetical protein [Treponema sp.]